MSSRAFSANSGQFDAGSTTTGSILRPSTPPAALSCSIVISATSLSDVSLIAMVPESECKMPTFTGPVSFDLGFAAGASATAPDAAAEGAAGVVVLSPGPLQPQSAAPHTPAIIQTFTPFII